MAKSFGAEALGADGFAVRGPVTAAPAVGCALVELGSNQLGWTSAPVALNSDLSLKVNRNGDTFTGDVIINRTWLGTPTEDKNVIKVGRYQSGSVATVNSPIAWYEHIADAPYPYCGFVLKHGLNPGIVDGRNPGGSYINMIGPEHSFAIQFDYLSSVGTPNYQGDAQYNLTGPQSKHIFRVNNGTEVGRIDANGLTVNGAFVKTALSASGGGVTLLQVGHPSHNMMLGSGENSRVQINTGGGLSNPVRALNVYSTNNDAPQIRFGYSNSFYWEMGRENGTTGDFVLTGASGPVLRITNSGSATFTGSVGYVQDLLTANTSNSGIRIRPQNLTQQVQMDWQEIRAANSYMVGTNFGSLDLFSAGVLRWRVDSNGNLVSFDSGGSIIAPNSVASLANAIVHRGAYLNYNAGMSGTTNYERGLMRWVGNEFHIGNEAGGTGTQRFTKFHGSGYTFMLGGSAAWYIDPNKDLLPANTVTNIGSASLPVNSLYLVSNLRFTGTNPTITFPSFGSINTTDIATIAGGANRYFLRLTTGGSGQLDLQGNGALVLGGLMNLTTTTIRSAFDSRSPSLVWGLEKLSIVGSGGFGNGLDCGTITQGTQDARWTIPAVGQRNSQVGNGSGTWQTGYREEYNAGGVRAGFFGATPVAQQSIAAAATDPATTQTLANSLRTAMLNLGLGV